MFVFPAEPVTPREFVEEVIPSLFAQLARDENVASADFKLGVSLRGAEGGDWTLRLSEGELAVAQGLSSDRDLTLLQSVADWRAALWEGRPRLVADAVKQLRRAAPGGITGDSAPTGLENPDALRELENLPGRVDAIIADDAGPDWQVGIQIGPGPVSDAPAATIRIGAQQAEALREGQLHPLEALITGMLRLEGDLGLILQIQAIAMAASMRPPSG